jgi:hypothetical protein
MHPLLSFPRGFRAIGLALIAASLACVTLAQDMSQLEARMRKAVENASARPGAPVAAPAAVAASSSAANDITQNVRNFDVDLAVFITTTDSVISCSSGKPAFTELSGAVLQKASQMRGYAQQLQSNPTLKAQAAAAFAPALAAALLQTRILDSACLNFAWTSSAAAQSAKPASAAVLSTAPTRYELVSAIMRQVFIAGDLRPQ